MPSYTIGSVTETSPEDLHDNEIKRKSELYGDIQRLAEMPNPYMGK